MQITEASFLTVLSNVTFGGSKPRKPSILLYIANHTMLQFLELQKLDNYWPEIHWRIDMEDFMAKSQNTFNLIEYRLDDAQIVSFEEWVKTAKPTVKTCLNYCAEKSIKISLTFTEKNESWCCSLTGREENKHNAGTTLTTWSEDPIEALMMAVFKTNVIFEDGKWQTRKSANRG